MPGVVYKGVVESISDATGAAFSLIPQDNATGNFVKVEQRVPGCVRMHFPVFAFSSVRCSDTQGTQTDAELAENQEAARRVSTDEEARIVPFQTVSVVPPGLEPRTP